MNKDFWEEQAKEFEYEVKATNFDPIADELELFFLEKLINKNDRMICDLGCGNGRTIINLAKKNKNTKFYGVDSSSNMINIAERKKEELNLENVYFYTNDATSKNLPDVFDFEFDKVVTKRLLINVNGDEKLKVVENIHSILKRDGLYIMTECFMDPLQKINHIRKLLNLKEIRVKHFNEYLTLDFFNEIKNYFIIKEKIDFGSLYYFTSRVFNAYLSDGEPEYHAPINELSAILTKNGINPLEGYSPEIIFLLEKKI
jgi:ubiquinone/menaquinone biosynthesis C-methylase UbiE